MNVTDFTPYVVGDRVSLRTVQDGFRPVGEIIDTHDGAWDVEVRWADGSWGRYSELDVYPV
jgi:hypothetical protein